MPKQPKADVAERIEHKLKLGLYLRSPGIEPGRQTWGGAGVIIRYPNSIGQGLDGRDERNDRDQSWDWNDEIFETSYAGAVEKLYRDIKEFAVASSHYNHLSKHELWREITKAGKSLAERSEAVDGETLLRCMWAVARELVSKWEGNGNKDVL